MSKENLDMVRADIKQLIDDDHLTTEETLELGVWLTGKSIGQAWQDAMGKPPE